MRRLATVVKSSREIRFDSVVIAKKMIFRRKTTIWVEKAREEEEEDLGKKAKNIV
jgi:hypothetical protein